MKNFGILFAFAFLFIGGCQRDQEKKEQLPVEDSTSKAQQKIHVDSLKKKNPLLILPPDSTYTGDYIDKYENGIVKFRGQYRFGKMHGHWLSFYPNGEAWSEMHYDKGLREGHNTTFYENGKKRYEGFFKHDMKDSIWIFYDENGKIAEKSRFSRDRSIQKLPVE